MFIPLSSLNCFFLFFFNSVFFEQVYDCSFKFFVQLGVHLGDSHW